MKEKQLLTNTEWEVCECLWEDSPLTMTQIAARLTERTGWTKSTGETLVRRMADKGLLRWEQGTKAKLYFPTVAREDAVVQETRGFLRKVFGGQRGAAGEHHGGAGGAEPGGDRPALRGPAEAGGKGP